MISWLGSITVCLVLLRRRRTDRHLRRLFSFLRRSEFSKTETAVQHPSAPILSRSAQFQSPLFCSDADKWWKTAAKELNASGLEV